jgi:hypothetical protein
MLNKKRTLKALKLTALSLITSLFLYKSTSRCGAVSYGLPKDFIQTYCSCGNHFLPIDLIGLVFDIFYHAMLWYSLLYLWQDAKETWGMMRGKISY